VHGWHGTTSNTKEKGNRNDQAITVDTNSDPVVFSLPNESFNLKDGRARRRKREGEITITPSDNQKQKFASARKRNTGKCVLLFAVKFG
jgi:hypothetical protein